MWLDRNLGISEACTSADGHEKKDSATTTTQANAVTSGNLFVIGHSD